MKISLEINRNTLQSPKIRLILCLLAFVVAATCLYGNRADEMARESMTPVTAVFSECRYRSSDSAINSNDIYLDFDDHDRLYLYQKCATDELTQRLIELEPGAKAEMLVEPYGRYITELEIDGEMWMSFETMQRTMVGQDTVFKWVSIVLFIVGGVLALSLLPELIRLLRRWQE
ncbi:MAG: hypothetical protein E7554_07125 [Ruminococcaceae bacterium]|nr:hypothetical protein [Oscillospiraceae bacterium]